MKSSPSIGVWIAVGLLVGWLVSLASLLNWALDNQTHVLWSAVAVLFQTFLCTGLFITAHDAMHGTVAPRKPGLNRLLGTVAVILYALFSFSKLTKQHEKHHAHPGHPERDPDFHDGRQAHPVHWYFRFLRHYLSVPQLVGMALIFNLLHHLLHVPLGNLLLFWVTPALLSTVQLFYFGTYLPHRHAAHEDDPHHAISSNFPVWLSFVTCFHFGYHAEHHEHPAVPWWRLPQVRWR